VRFDYNGLNDLGELLADYVHNLVGYGQRVLLLVTSHCFSMRQVPWRRQGQL